jgi:hypothetical protein
VFGAPAKGNFFKPRSAMMKKQTVLLGYTDPLARKALIIYAEAMSFLWFRLGHHRIAELAGNDSSPEASAELDHLAGKRRWDGSRDPLTSAVAVTETAIQLTSDWLRKELCGPSDRGI